MGIAVDPNFRQMDNRGIAAMAIDGLGPQFGHGKTDSPLVLAGVVRGFCRNIVAVIDDDGNFGQLDEIRQGHA